MWPAQPRPVCSFFLQRSHSEEPWGSSLLSAWLTPMLSLIFCFMAVSGIFILLGAEFLAAIQILVYLASVGLVVLFGIMLTRRQILEEDFE